MKRECETCVKRKTLYCPTSLECMATDDMPYYQNRIMLLEENQELKKQQKEFIKYLEDKIKEVEKIIELLSDTGSCRIPDLQYKKLILEEILQKYKEIVNGTERN